MDLSKLTLWQLYQVSVDVSWEIFKRTWWAIPIIVIVLLLTATALTIVAVKIYEFKEKRKNRKK